MPEYNSALQMSVIRDGYKYKDRRAAIAEAWELSKKLGVAVDLSYAGQYVFRVFPDSTQEQITEMQNAQVVIGV